jgi:hypothetical protein
MVPRGMWSRSVRALRSLTPAGVLMLLACVLVVSMYWRNDDMAGQPVAPRAPGQSLPILDRGAGHMLYLMARPPALDFDWVFDNDLRAFGDPWGQPRNAAGHKQIPHPIGPALVWTPLIWVAQGGATVANWFGADIPMHGYTPFHQRFVFLSSVAAALFAVLLGRRIASKFIGGTWSPTYGAVAVLLGTSVTYYATYMPSYGHALDAGASGAFLGVWALTFGRTSPRRFVLLGLLLGIAMLIRVQDVALGIVVVVEFVHGVVSDLQRRAVDWRIGALLSLSRCSSVLVVALVVFVPQLVYWKVTYGDWFSPQSGQGGRYTRLGSPMMLELLYSARNGWFTTTPVAYLAVLGLPLVPRRARLIALAFGLAILVQVYLCSTIMDYWGMAGWGQRRLCSVTLPLVFGLAALVWRLGWLAAKLRRIPRIVWHVLAILVLGSMIWWNLWRVQSLRAGKAAPTDLEATCCRRLPRWASGSLVWVYNHIGNPFEFPANALFALRHGVEIQRWDRAVGNYPLMPSMKSLISDAFYRERGAWRIGYPGADPYLIGHWSAAKTGENRAMRWTVSPAVTALVPNLVPETQRYSLALAPGGAHDVVLRWDGEVVARETLTDGWQYVTFEVADVSVGEHELTIEAPPGPVLEREGWPTPALPVGVAVNRLEVELVAP